MKRINPVARAMLKNRQFKQQTIPNKKKMNKRWGKDQILKDAQEIITERHMEEKKRRS